MRMWKLLAIWLILVVVGFGYLINYSATAGVGDEGRSLWPGDTSIPRTSDRPTLLVFVHPECPCSHATIEELARLVARAPGAIAVTVLFTRPDGFPAGWEQTDLWHGASRIPGAAVETDAGGREARRFNAATSGYTLLYNEAGSLVFRGGITASRGHEGDNVGKSSILGWIRDCTIVTRETPVFGCRLFDHEQ